MNPPFPNAESGGFKNEPTLPAIFYTLLNPPYRLPTSKIKGAACIDDDADVNVEQLLNLVRKNKDEWEPTTWSQLGKREKVALSYFGFTQSSYDNSDFVKPWVKNIAGTLQDPLVWFGNLIALGKIAPSSISFVKQIMALRGFRAVLADGFTTAEIKVLNDLLPRTGLDFSRITFWRGQGAPPSFTTTFDHQLFILKEEYAHALQLIVEFSDDSIRAAEEAAKLFRQGGQ